MPAGGGEPGQVPPFTRAEVLHSWTSQRRFSRLTIARRGVSKVTMTVQVKICGIKQAAALDAALAAGADFFGLVFYPRSPRNVDRAEARGLVERAAGRARSVALLVDPSDEDVSAIAGDVRPDYIQLHGAETPERVREVARLSGRQVIKAIRVADAADVAAAASYRPVAAFLLFDAKPCAGDTGALPGGNGVPFDWQALLGLRDDRSFMLSGGLDPDNVAAAIAGTNAAMVDVSSGVERAPGDKDPALIRRFVAAAKAARATAA